MLQFVSWILGGSFLWFAIGCSKTDPNELGTFEGFKVPKNFPAPVYDVTSVPVTRERFELGRKLFYESMLSRDNTISCGSCHNQSAAFTHHGHDLSHGIDDKLGKRNAPPIQNMAWYSSFMWDGGVHNLDMQPIAPIENPVEMDESLANVLQKLRKSSEYARLFKLAYGSTEINSARMLQAIGHFMAMMVSANSKYDKVMRNEGASFTVEEAAGYEVFKSKCASCHTEPLFTDQQFRDNGIGVGPNNDLGRYEITLLPADQYTFKVPSLRNVQLTAPYMHDGRLRTLDAVLRHYHEEVQATPNLDARLKRPDGKRGIPLTTAEMSQLKAFLFTLTDDEFIRNPALSEQ